MANSPDQSSALFVRVRSSVCAVPLAHVVEIMRPLHVEPIAGMPPFVRGLSIIRGAPIPVVKLGALLGVPDEGGVARLVTLRIDDRRVALEVEGVLGVRELAKSMVQEMPPLLQDAGAEVVEAIGTLDAQLLVVLRATRIVPEDVWQTLAAREATP